MHIAVIGAGVSGLVSTYLLQRAHHVELFEQRSTAGGHANTVLATDEAGRELPLDVGFIVYNERTYHVFARLLRELGVETQPSDMSFGVRSDPDHFEFSSRGVPGYLAQPRTLLSPTAIRMGLDVLRFQREAHSALKADAVHEIDFAEYLRRGRYSPAFRDRMIIPLIASTWSNSPADVLNFPANYLLRFLEQHGVLARNNIPEWRWIRGGARMYVEAVLRTLSPGSVHLGAAVEGVTRTATGATVQVAGETPREFDAVILACHADQALALLCDPSHEERTALTDIRYAPNQVVLHTDDTILPRNPRARAAWNYHHWERDGAPDTLTMTYDLNRLERISGPTTYCVSVNPGERVAAGRVVKAFDYSHPVFTMRTPAAQARLEALQGVRNTYYAGAYLGYGFHEDGARSGMRVAERLGVSW